MARAQAKVGHWGGGGAGWGVEETEKAQRGSEQRG